MSLRQLSIQWKITLLAGLCLAGIVTLLVGLSLYRMEHSSALVKASSMEMLTEAAQARIESQGENQASGDSPAVHGRLSIRPRLFPSGAVPA
jgi:methyl-accepting chemotaxis protein